MVLSKLCWCKWMFMNKGLICIAWVDLKISLTAQSYEVFYAVSMLHASSFFGILSPRHWITWRKRKWISCLHFERLFSLRNFVLQYSLLHAIELTSTFRSRFDAFFRSPIGMINSVFGGCANTSDIYFSTGEMTAHLINFNQYFTLRVNQYVQINSISNVFI